MLTDILRFRAVLGRRPSKPCVTPPRPSGARG